MTVLVLIYKTLRGNYRYARYEGREEKEVFTTVSPLSAYWVEEIRREPTSLEAEAGGPEAA